MKNRPEDILGLTHALSGEDCYCFSQEKFNGIKAGPDYKAKAGIKILLQLMFGSNPSSADEKSIIHTRNYYNYFADRVLQSEVEETDFMRLLTDENQNIRETLFGWKNHRPSLTASVSAHFARHALKDMTDVTAARFVRALLYWWEMTSGQKALHKLKYLTETSYNRAAFESAQRTYFEVLTEMIDSAESGWDKYCDAVMAQTPLPEDASDQDNEIGVLIRFLSVEQAMELIAKIVRKAVIKGDIHNVDDLSKPGSEVVKILSHSITETRSAEGEFLLVDNYAIDELITCWIDLVKHDPSAAGRDIESLRHEYSYISVDDPDEEEYLSNQAYERRLRVFDSDKNLQRVINELYDIPKEQKESAINYLSLR